ncbi:ECF transporter S component [Alkalithermobacter paradoxus]|uniref:Thiamine transporter HmpT n=1 Tax=Alkalithermobacter paradoxus TaxID=29349 RepID=A0A1V4I6J4_9FIRM|nr:thiamine precursor transporter HmpT [[Clostridium] thermoalcaliphilum]
MERTKKLTLTAVMVALVCVGTMVINIPMPATNGFVNIGDSMIFITSILFGPTVGMIAGGIGSALADILLGYAHWAPFTLVIKGLEGFVVGYIVRKSLSKGRMVFGTLAGAAIMIIGYYIAGGVLYDFAVSLKDIPGNIIQGASSIAIGVPIAIAIGNTSYFRNNIKSKV